MAPPKSRWGRWSRIGGWLLQLVAVIYVGCLLFQYLPTIRETTSGISEVTIVLVVVTLISSASLALHFRAWLTLLRGASITSPNWRPALWLFGRTLIAKYLPSNTLHYAGRQILGAQLGWKQNEILSSSIAEIVVVVSACCAFGVAPQLLVGLDGVQWLERFPPPLIIGSTLLFPVALVGILQRVSHHLGPLAPIGAIAMGRWILSYAYFLGFLAVGATAFAFPILFLENGFPPERLPLLLGGYGFSYVVGYVTPGSPGGIGVREATLTLTLGPVLGAPIVLFAAIMHRLGSVIAEAGLFGGTFLLHKRPAARSKPGSGTRQV